MNPFDLTPPRFMEQGGVIYEWDYQLKRWVLAKNLKQEWED